VARQLPTAPNTASAAQTPATPPAAAEFIEVSRRFGAVTALDRVSLRVLRGEFFSLLGPSGCGKTTLLRLLAGLDWPDAGEIHLGGRPATRLPAHQRPVNTVFQSYALFPHLSVWDNVAFGLRMKRVSFAELERRVRAVMELTQISDLRERRPAQLSGGQKQRVALARALVNEPEVLLLDEPLGALDLGLRRRLQSELKALQRRLGITFIHVTHDQEEALAMSDPVGILRAGRLEQVGAPPDLYEHPRTRFVAEFLGACNFITARRTALNRDGRVAFETPLGQLWVPAADLKPDRDTVTLAVRPEKIQLAPADSLAGNDPATRLAGPVRDIVYAGAETQYQVEVAGQTLRVQTLNAAAGGPSVRVGDAVTLRVPPGALRVLED
jgi:spermidine/putrescine transport system ATP-binding protein